VLVILNFSARPQQVDFSGLDFHATRLLFSSAERTQPPAPQFKLAPFEILILEGHA
jgi:hypothetical protein